MSKRLENARTALIAIVSAFVAIRFGYYLANKSFSELDQFDYMVAVPGVVMSVVLFGVCIKALVRSNLR